MSEIKKIEDSFCFPDEKYAIRDEFSDILMNFQITNKSFTFDMGDSAIIARGDNLKKFIRVMKTAIAFYKDQGVTD